MKDEAVYEELVRKLRSQYESFKKWQRKLMNEPESEAKYAQVELMQKVIDRSREVVNWWDNYEAKMERRAKKEQEAQKKQEKEVNRKKVDQYIAKAIKGTEQEYNTTCRYYCQSGSERSCSCGMDMTFCGKRCAFATNMVGSSRVYDAPVTVNHKRVR